MTRIRYLSASWPNSVRNLATKLKSSLFSLDSDAGFIIDRARDGFVDARHIERYSFTDRQIDPFGQEFTTERVAFTETKFSVYASEPLLEVVDSPRGLQTFINKLAEVNDFNVGISPIGVDVLEWSARIEAELNYEMIIDSIQISDLEVEQGTSAKVIIKGERDVRSALKKIANGKKYTVEKAKIRYQGYNAGSIFFANTASLKFSLDTSPPDFLAKARKALLAIN